AEGARGDAQEREGDHRRQDLQADGVVVVAEELADLEVLLDPAEEQLNLPAALVQGSDLHRRAFEVIGQEINRAAALVPFQANATQAHWQFGIALAGEAHLAVFQNGEAITFGLADRTLFDHLKAHIDLGPGDEERTGLVDGAPPAVVAIAL